MITKYQPIYGKREDPGKDITPRSTGTVHVISRDNSERGIRQTHEAVLRDSIKFLLEVIPEQYKMKVEGTPNPVEKQFIKDSNLTCTFEERNNESAILFEFNFDSHALDFYERKKLSSKLQSFFNNESNLPIVIHAMDGSFSKHIVCVRDLKQFRKLQALYNAQKKVKPCENIKKAIPFIKESCREIYYKD